MTGFIVNFSLTVKNSEQEMTSSIKTFAGTGPLYDYLAELIIRDIDRLSHDQFYSLALSGGKTPLGFYSHLAARYSERIKWEKVLFFWGDERCVEPDSDESNYKAAFETLLANVPVPDNNVFRIRGEADPVVEAEQYSEVVGMNVAAFNDTPQFDLMILGMGPDGHTASIFPDSVRLFRSNKLYEVSARPSTGQKRITVTGRLINNSSKVIFLITGEEKAELVARITSGEPGSEKYPASYVRPASGQLLWLLDSKAASRLQNLK